MKIYPGKNVLLPYQKNVPYRLPTRNMFWMKWSQISILENLWIPFLYKAFVSM
jgi:hypothetical protein